MTDLAVVEKTPLAGLIEKRESLQEDIKRWRRRLARGGYESVQSQEEYYKRRHARLQEELSGLLSKLDGYITKLEKAREFEADRLRVLGFVTNEDLRTLLERQNKEADIVRCENEIPVLRLQIAEAVAAMAEPFAPEDHKTNLLNGLAAAEVELEGVLLEIRREKRNSRAA